MSTKYALTNGFIITGREDNTISRGAILIEDKNIVDIGSMGEVDIPSDAKIIDLKGHTIMPGLVDAHIHITGFRTMDYVKEALLVPYETFVARSIRDLENVINAGYTTICDAGSKISLYLKQAVNEGIIKSPRIVASGYPISQTFGHGDIHYLPIELVDARTSNLRNPFPTLICDGADECRKAARYALREGADFIKIFTTGGVASQRDRPEYPQMTLDEIKAVVEEAKRVGSFVHAHAEGSEGIKNALKGGVKVIAHGMYLDDDGINLLIEKNAILVPTLTIGDILLKYGSKHGLPEWAIRKMEEVHDTHLESIKKAYKSKVKMATGTDFFVGIKETELYGLNSMELKLFVDKVGMKPIEAIIASARNGAEAAGLSDKTGILEKGRYADIVVVKGNPLDNINILLDKNNIKMVFKEGIIMKNTL